MQDSTSRFLSSPNISTKQLEKLTENQNWHKKTNKTKGCRAFEDIFEKIETHYHWNCNAFLVKTKVKVGSQATLYNWTKMLISAVSWILHRFGWKHLEITVRRVWMTAQWVRVLFSKTKVWIQGKTHDLHDKKERLFICCLLTS